jgi:choline monooxygenase
MIDIKKEIERFPGNAGAESAHTPPASWYTHPEFFARDAKLLKAHWQPVGHLGMVAAPGAFFSGDFLGEPYLVVRGADGELRAFFNVCRHHATCLVEGKGEICEGFVCPYHGWAYDLDGGLKRAPHMAGVKNFNKAEMGLKPIPLRLFGPLILLNFSGSGEELPADWKSLEDRMAATGWEKLQFVERKSYEIRCNWKVYVDNYLDGGYHVSHLHKGLAGQLNLEGYKIENFANYTLQSCGGADGAQAVAGDFQERIGSEALYAWLYPNFMINRYGNIMDTNWVIPLDANRCITVFDYYFLDPGAKDFISASLEASDKVQQEDIAICESVQRGLASVAYDVGRYAPKLEGGAYLFHQLLQRDLRLT